MWWTTWMLSLCFGRQIVTSVCDAEHGKKKKGQSWNIKACVAGKMGLDLLTRREHDTSWRVLRCALILSYLFTILFNSFDSRLMQSNLYYCFIC
ncbi:hypothetical protein NMG60_11023987 [Bertholletia excelsa]